MDRDGWDVTFRKPPYVWGLSGSLLNLASHASLTSLTSRRGVRRVTEQSGTPVSDPGLHIAEPHHDEVAGAVDRHRGLRLVVRVTALMREYQRAEYLIPIFSEKPPNVRRRSASIAARVNRFLTAF